VKSPISLGCEDIELVEELSRLGSVISTDGGTEKDISVRMGKARYAFRVLQPVWLSRQLSLTTKTRIFICETWRSTKALDNRLQGFVNKFPIHLAGESAGRT